jgi:hypothetical protein
MSLPELSPYELYEDRGPSIIIGSATVNTLATIATIARFAARYFYGKGIKLDDWLILPAVVSLAIPPMQIHHTNRQKKGPFMGFASV